jgi:2-polyprenyl-3-methyl-5-hydroxy-6-metoxy-1,4-benzoquinol methylase
MTEKKDSPTAWPHGMVPLSRDEIHHKVIELADGEPRGKALDAPAGTGILADRLRKMGFDVSCCDIDASYFSAPGMSLDIGDLSQSLPYSSASFNLITCIEGIEHLENPFHAVREFYRVLKPGGKLILSLPNYLNIERRLRFLITGLFSKIPSPRKLGKDRFEHLWMLHLTPLTYPVLKLMMEHSGFKILHIEKDKEKKRMKWLLPVVWAIRGYCFFWSAEKKEDYHLEDTLSDTLIMGGNTLIVVGEKIG